MATETTTKHTPGPWAVCTWASHMPLSGWPSEVCADDGEGDGTTICMFYKVDLYDFDRAAVEANARLIAAAPDLLAACEAALDELEYFHEPQMTGTSGIIRDLRAAIAKARGTNTENEQ